MKIPSRFLPVVLWFARIALAAGFLSAVADRFGLWGAPGAKGVVWGNWENFASYSASLNAFAPAFLQGPLALAGMRRPVGAMAIFTTKLVETAAARTAAVPHESAQCNPPAM